MRYERRVVGKHPIGIPEVGRCKHVVCARIGVGAKASRVEFSQANLDSQLPLRSSKRRERLYLPNNGAWWLLFVGCESSDVLMQAVARHESQGGAANACAHETTSSADSWQYSRSTALHATDLQYCLILRVAQTHSNANSATDQQHCIAFC